MEKTFPFHYGLFAKRWVSLITPLFLTAFLHAAEPSVKIDFAAITNPVIFRGNETTAYRDPAAIYHDGWFRLFFTLVKIEPDQRIFSYTAWSKSRDLVHWTEPKIFTPRDQNLNYSSPGNIIRFGNKWVLCLQTYPRPNGERGGGNNNARIWTMRSQDLETWSEPELLRVKGPDVPPEQMGRMIDPFLLASKDEPGKWWCFYKQNGISISWSKDLKNWTYDGRIEGGIENPCVIVDGNDYALFYSPGNGIGMKRSHDLKTWSDEGVLTLGQKAWPWAQGRLTAGFVTDLRKEPGVGKAVMFFHGSDFREGDPRGGFNNFASIGLAWSDNLKTWKWPSQGDQAFSKGSSEPVKPVANIVPTYVRVSYGEYPAQVMDVWLAKSDKPTPVVVSIHGGAWEAGGRSGIQKAGLNTYLQAGVSVVSIDYRFITPAIKEGVMPPVQWPLSDAARAIQFIRSKAKEWNLDKTRLGLTGNSAGGCSSLWLAMHDDMADPKSLDPIARESTRVSCVSVTNAQSSLDPKQLREWFKNPTYGAHAFGFVKEKNGHFVGDMESCFSARERILPWIKEYSPIEWASQDDPPIFLAYYHVPEPAGQPQTDSTHGAAFGMHLKERLDALGVECHIAYPFSTEDPEAPHIKFLIQKLTVGSQ